MQLGMLIDLAQTDSSVRVIFIHGGKNFTSGSNMSNYGKDSALLEKETFYQSFSASKMYANTSAIMAIKNSVKPIVGLVRGWNFGNGFAISSFFTFLYCTPEAKFIAPAVAAFSTPEAATTLMFPKIIGSRKANELILLSTPLTAQEAKRFNFVNEILTELEDEGDWPEMKKIPAIS